MQKEANQTDFDCVYSGNETVCTSIQRICGYREYAERICMYTENTQNTRKVKYIDEFETIIRNILSG